MPQLPARPVPRSLLAAFVAAVLVVSCSAPASSPAPTTAADAPAGPGLVAKQATLDLGRVPFDRQVEARHELVNTGDQPVKLTAKPRVTMLEGC